MPLPTTPDIAPAPFQIDQDDLEITSEAVHKLSPKDRVLAVPYPQFEALQGSLSDEAAKFLGEKAAEGEKPELTVHLPILYGDSLLEILGNFRQRFGKRHTVYADPPVWGMSLGRHNRGLRGQVVSVALADVQPGAETDESSVVSAEAGLALTDLSNVDQQHGLEIECGTAEVGNNVLRAMTLSEYLVLQAKRAIQGKPPLDIRTMTRFLYPDRSSESVTAGINGNRLRITQASATTGSPNIGVRRVLQLMEI